MSLAVLANHMATKGRHGDDMLVHMSKDEVAALQRLAEQHGLTLTINPETGLPEAFSLKSLLKAVAPLALGWALGPAGFGLFETSLGASLAVGGIGALATGSLEKGLMMGLSAYGGSELGQSLVKAGAAATAPVTSAAEAAGAGTTVSPELSRQLARNVVPASFGETPFGLANIDAGAIAPNVSPAFTPSVEGLPAGLSEAQQAAQMPYQQQQAFNRLPVADKLSNIYQGVAADPLAFAKKNITPLAMAGLPALAMLDSQNTLKGMTTETDPSKVRFSRFAFDPLTRTMVRVPGFSLAEYRAGTASPVGSFNAADGGIVALADGGTTPSYQRTSMAPGMLDFAERSEPVVRMADGGAAPSSVEDLYKNILGRAGDTGGLEYWKQQFGSEIDPNEVAQFTTAAQAELAARGPTPTPAPPPTGFGGLPGQGMGAQSMNMQTAGAATTGPTSVEDLYKNVLGRTADTSGLDYWKKQFGAEIDPNEVAQFTAAAQAELAARNAAGAGARTVTTPPPPPPAPTPAAAPTDAQKQAVINWYRSTLGRDPDQAGLNYWAGRIANEKSGDVFKSFLDAARTHAGTGAGLIKNVTEQEAESYKGYLSGEGTNVADEWVRNVLGREPNAQDKAQSWYKNALSGFGTNADTVKGYEEFSKYAKAQKPSATIPTSWFEAAQLKELKKTDTSTTTQPPDITGRPAPPIYRPPNITSVPIDLGTPAIGRVIPGSGTVPTMQEVVDAYVRGGGSLGYIPYAPKTVAEMESRYQTSGGSKSTYDYLMGKSGAKYPTIQRPEGGIAQPYWKAAGMTPRTYTVQPPKSGGGTTIDTSNINPNAPAGMQAAYDSYWKDTPVDKEIDWAGGKLKRTSKDSATFTAADGKTVFLSPRSRFIDLASAHPDILKLWKETFGYDLERDKPVNPPDQGGGGGEKAGGLMSLARGGYAEGGAPDDSQGFYDEQGNFRSYAPANSGIAAVAQIGAAQEQARAAEAARQEAANQGIAALDAGAAEKSALAQAGYNPQTDTATKAPTAEDYARAQIQQELNRAGTAEEIANRASQITVDPNKGYATEVFYDPLGQRIERPVFMTGPSAAQVVAPNQFPGAAEDQNIPYIARNAAQVLGKDNSLYSTMEHNELLRQTMDPARLAYMQDQAAKDAARLGPYSQGPFTAGPANFQLPNAIAQANKLGPLTTPDAKRSLAQQIVQLGYDPTGKYDPEIMQIVQQLKGTGMAGGGDVDDSENAGIKLLSNAPAFGNPVSSMHDKDLSSAYDLAVKRNNIPRQRLLKKEMDLRSRLRNPQMYTQQETEPQMAGGGRIPLGILAAAASGGQFDLGGYSDGGRLLKGPGDGVSDSIPATIGGKRPARLADGEFVVPARIVSELGNGSTDAGARKLYAMMDRIQANRSKTTGKGKVAVNSRADKYLPA